MSDRIAPALVPADGSIRDAMRALDAGALRIALVVDEGGRLVGVTTDGDVRRALLSGAGLDDPLGPHLTRSFTAVTPRDGRAEVIELMRARHIGAVPVLDGAGRPVALHLLDEALTPVNRPNWAVVMAGGRGVRLGQLTETIPKPMLRVAGRPILERIVLHLVGHGITRIYLAVGYLGHQIEEHFGDGRELGARIGYLREDVPLGTGGALGLLPKLPDEPILVMNGDLVTQANLGSLLDAHVSGNRVATIGVRRYIHAVPFGCVDRDGDRVLQLEEKPALTRDVNTGIYALAPALVARVERGRPVAMPDLITDALARGEPVGAFEIEDDWIDVGQREQLDRARGGGDA
ncbi:MAG: sugar phosphate nucleotidyltransferase [Chloroflexota bacterium]